MLYVFCLNNSWDDHVLYYRRVSVAIGRRPFIRTWVQLNQQKKIWRALRALKEMVDVVKIISIKLIFASATQNWFFFCCSIFLRNFLSVHLTEIRTFCPSSAHTILNTYNFFYLESAVTHIITRRRRWWQREMGMRWDTKKVLEMR